MKIKLVLLTLLGLLMLFCMSQIFSIPPYAEDVYPVYRSGYFQEIEKGFRVISDSFISIKTLSRPEYAWIFLQDMSRDNGIDIRVYDRNGFQVPAPGRKGAIDRHVAAVIQASRPGMKSEISGGRYITVIPVGLHDRCRFCHSADSGEKLVGALRFERDYDAHVYYTSERVIIFVLLSLAAGLLLVFTARWEPGKTVKELFDKNK